MKKIYFSFLLILCCFIYHNNVKAISSYNITKDSLYSYNLNNTNSTYNSFNSLLTSYNSALCLAYGNSNDSYTSNAWECYTATNLRVYNGVLQFNQTGSFLSFPNYNFSAISTLTTSYGWRDINDFGIVLYAKNIILPSGFDIYSYSNINVVAGCSNSNLYGIFQLKYDPNYNDCSPKMVNYNVNVYYDNKLQSNLSYTSSDYVRNTITINNFKTDYYSIDDSSNVYSLLLNNNESNNVVNLYYYDRYFGTDYQQIDSSNSTIFFPISYELLKKSITSIDYYSLTSYQQLVLLIGVNILFISFIFLFIWLLRYCISILRRFII